MIILFTVLFTNCEMDVIFSYNIKQSMKIESMYNKDIFILEIDVLVILIYFFVCKFLCKPLCKKHDLNSKKEIVD
jgi:hypothetical protein